MLTMMNVVATGAVQRGERRGAVLGDRARAAASRVRCAGRRVLGDVAGVAAAVLAGARCQSESGAPPHDRPAPAQDVGARVSHGRLALHYDDGRGRRLGAHLLHAHRGQNHDHVPAHRAHWHGLVVCQAVPLEQRQADPVDCLAAPGARQHRPAHH